MHEFMCIRVRVWMCTCVNVCMPPHTQTIHDNKIPPPPRWTIIVAVRGRCCRLLAGSRLQTPTSRSISCFLSTSASLYLTRWRAEATISDTDRYLSTCHISLLLILTERSSHYWRHSIPSNDRLLTDSLARSPLNQSPPRETMVANFRSHLSPPNMSRWQPTSLNKWRNNGLRLARGHRRGRVPTYFQTVQSAGSLATNQIELREEWSRSFPQLVGRTRTDDIRHFWAGRPNIRSRPQ